MDQGFESLGRPINNAGEWSRTMAEQEAGKVDKEVGDAAFAPKPKPEKDRVEDGFEIFGSDPETIKFSIGEVSFAAMKIGQIRRFVKEAGKLLPVLNTMILSDGSVNLTKLQEFDQEALMNGLAIATNCTVAKLDQLELPEFIRLVTKVLLVNIDFFVQTLPKVMGGVAKSLTKSMETYGVGPMLSSASSVPVIPSKT
jgi:hypothetical protein